MVRNGKWASLSPAIRHESSALIPNEIRFSTGSAHPELVEPLTLLSFDPERGRVVEERFMRDAILDDFTTNLHESCGLVHLLSLCVWFNQRNHTNKTHQPISSCEFPLAQRRRSGREMPCVMPRSLSDIDCAAAANDPPIIFGILSHKNPQCIPSSTPPVFLACGLASGRTSAALSHK